jgi:signal transduction histidine kinase
VLNQASFLEDDFTNGLTIWSMDGSLEAATSNQGPWLDVSILEQVNLELEEYTYFVEVDLDVQRGVAVALLYRVDDLVIVGVVPVLELMQSANLNPTLDIGGHQAYIISEEGQVLSDIGIAEEQERVLNQTSLNAALRGEIGSSFLPSEAGEYVAAYAPIQITDWALVIEEPWEAVASPILDFSLAGPLVLAPALLLTLLALWFGSRQIIGPLRRLEQIASTMLLGQPEKVHEEAGGIAEIRNLQNTLFNMSTRIHLAQDALRGYIGAITRAQEDERKRLARELHDETIQDLIALGQKIQMLEMRWKSQEFSSQAAIHEISAALQESIESIRRISRGLRPIYLEELGLVPALEMIIHDLALESEIEVGFQLSGDVERMNPDTEMALYRIVQESLSNISRHSRAQSADMRIEYADDALTITIRDDGVGFEPPDLMADLAHQDHYGLIGMTERADLLGADLDIKTAPGEGTLIRIELHHPKG